MPQAGTIGQFLSTVGLEIEGTFLDRRSVMNIVGGRLMNYLENSSLTVHRDASNEWDAEVLRLGDSNRILMSSTHTPEAYRLSHLRVTENTRMGYEIITNALELPEMEALVYPLLQCLESAGDIPSNRSAIHFHVGFAHNLRMMKNLLRLSLTLDPILFRLGGMGGKNRGYINNFAYARPLLHSCVVPVRRIDDDGEPSRYRKYAYVINPMKALEAVTMEEFWASFGYHSSMGVPKYHPMRYTGCNMFSILAHNTAEWRHCNNTFNPHLVVAIMKFMRGVVELSTALGKHANIELPILDSATEIPEKDAVDIVEKIIALCVEHDVDDLPNTFEIDTIMRCIAESSYGGISDAAILTHNKDFSVPQNIVDLGGLKVVTKVTQSGYTDIHNIKLLSLITEGESQ